MLQIEFSSPRDQRMWEKKLEKTEKRKTRQLAKMSKRMKEYWRKRKRAERRLKKKKPRVKRTTKKERKISNGYGKRSLPFFETAIGHYLYVYAPLQYHLYTSFVKKTGIRGNDRASRLALIECLAQQSKDPVFASVRYRKAVITYRRFGQRQHKRSRWYLDDVLYYAKNSHHIHLALKEIVEL